MEDPENYYDTYKDTQGCKRTFWILVILGIMIILWLLFGCTAMEK